MADPWVAEHFESLEQQRHAAVFGMWIFVASEVLLFGGMFVLYGAYRVAYPTAFSLGIAHNLRGLGTANTAILIVSSYFVAQSVADLRAAHRRRTAAWLCVAAMLGLAFLVLKGLEYGEHFHEGIFPGGSGRFFQEHREPGLSLVFSLYYLMTGAHALHVTVGIIMLFALAWMVAKRAPNPRHLHTLENGAMYWHLVDIVWIFLWPLYYLTGGNV